MMIDKKTRFVIMEGMKIKKIFWSLSDARDYLERCPNYGQVSLPTKTQSGKKHAKQNFLK
jgi:uncharacterized OB-fold protein